MDKLNLPVIKKLSIPPKRLDMNAYLELVEFNLHHVLSSKNRKIIRKQRRRQVILVPFQIK